MALTPAQKQRRYRARQRAKAAADPRTLEAALLAKAKRSARGSDRARHARADRIMVAANDYLWRAQRLAEAARKLRPSGLP